MDTTRVDPRIRKTNQVIGEALKLAIELREQGWYYEDIAAKLNSLGYKTRTGRRFTGTSVRSYLLTRM